MQAVGIERLKDKLSEYVPRAAAWEMVLVIDRARVVAELRRRVQAEPGMRRTQCSGARSVRA